MTTTHTPTTYEVDAALRLVKRVESFVRRCRRWHAHCEAYQVGSGDYNIRLMPSKAAKHRAYGDAAQALRLMGIEGVRPSTLDELTDTVALVRHAAAVAR